LSEIALPQRLTLLLDNSSPNSIQRWLWVLSTGGTLLDGYVIFVLGVAMPIIVVEFNIQPDVVGLIGASLVFGAVIGAGIGGPMADHVGRKKLMLADMIIIGAGASISALANGPAMLFVGQLLVGTGVGIDFPVSSSYISEILPKRSRARMFPTQLRGTASGFAAAVAKLGATLGVFLLPIVKEKFGLQSVLGIVSAVSLLGLIITFALRRENTDSPSFGIVEVGGK
jgi:MFS family permease